MSLSDEEDDFLSADEDAYDEESKTKANREHSEKPSIIVPEVKQKSDALEKEPVRVIPKPVEDKQRADAGESYDKITSNSKKTSSDTNKSPPASDHSGSSKPIGSSNDEDEALQERIRARQLEIARRFSQKIAQNVQASAPIPVKVTKVSETKSNNDYDESNCLGSKTTFSPPPAPPPTPALSSSFSNSNEPTMIACASNNNSPASDTQYRWRVPRPVGGTTPTTVSDPEQTRQALDRLADNLARNEKNLFEQVAEDIKKVSLRSTREVGDTTREEDRPSIPLISDLSSAFGGWGWDSATKLIASSASQVTSLTGSVLDTVVNVTSLEPKQSTSSREGRSSGSPPNLPGSDKTVDDQSIVKSSPQNTDGNVEGDDGLVDLTLNAMESLGKKAFGTLTERNESGSLQIKGIGRPWDYLLKPLQSASEDDEPEPVIRASSSSKKKND